MKVLALGGSGGMGRFSSYAISNYSNITKVTIADLNEANAKEFSNHFDDRFTGIGLDVTDKEHLEKVMSGHDIVLNTNDKEPDTVFQEILEKLEQSGFRTN